MNRVSSRAGVHVEADRHLTLNELAERMRTSPNTVYGWNKTRTGPRYMKVGRACLYKLSDVIAWENGRYADLDGAA